MRCLVRARHTTDARYRLVRPKNMCSTITVGGIPSVALSIGRVEWSRGPWRDGTPIALSFERRM
jgi:hypothetical protein